MRVDVSKINYITTPFSHFIIPNFFNEEELESVHKEIDFIEQANGFTYNQSDLNTAKKDDEYIASRKGIFLNKFFNEENHRVFSSIYRSISKIYQEEALEFLSQFGTFGKLLKYTNSDSVLVSRYYNGDYYKPHKDFSLFTLLIYVWKEKTFTGGDLIFTKYNYSIAPENNLAVLFPGQEWHGVTPIVSQDSSTVQRTSISMFIHINFND